MYRNTTIITNLLSFPVRPICFSKIYEINRWEDLVITIDSCDTEIELEVIYSYIGCVQIWLAKCQLKCEPMFTFI